MSKSEAPLTVATRMLACGCRVEGRFWLLKTDARAETIAVCATYSGFPVLRVKSSVA